MPTSAKVGIAGFFNNNKARLQKCSRAFFLVRRHPAAASNSKNGCKIPTAEFVPEAAKAFGANNWDVPKLLTSSATRNQMIGKKMDGKKWVS